MIKRKELVTKYDQQYKDLHDEFFETINEGTSKQARVLRSDKSADALNTRYAEITQNYEAELIANGFEGLNPEPPEPVMDYKAEILKLQDEVKKLKEK